MRGGVRVVYVGPDPIFRDLEGTLVEAEDRATRKVQLHFQPESSGIKPLPCLAEHVRPVAHRS